MELVILERKSRLLTPSRLPCLGSLPTLRLASGCVHGCLNCFAEGSCGPRDSEKVVFSDDTVKKLRKELGRRHGPPPAIVFDFACDPFQPVPEVLDRTCAVLECLLGEGIGVVFQTKAKIPPRHRELLLAHAPLVRAIIPLVTTNRRLLRIFETANGHAAVAPGGMRWLVAGGVATLARVDPILPGLTDDPDTMHGLCAALAEAGIREIAAGSLVLRPALANTLRQRLARPELCRRLTQGFARGNNQRFCGGRAAVRVLPAARRQRTFQWLTTIAGQYGIAVRVCGCKNPDLGGQSCKLAGPWSPPQVVERQLGLFS